MADEKFVDFARRRLKFGTLQADVAATLRINGLSEAEIEEVLAAAQGVPATPTTPTPISAPPQEPAMEPAPEVDTMPAPEVAAEETMPPEVAPEVTMTPTSTVAPEEVVPQEPAPSPAQETPLETMSHITVMPKMPPAAASVVEAAPTVAPEPRAPISVMPERSKPVATPEVPAPLIYAGFWRRVIAAFIDGIILTFLYAAVVIGVSFSLGTSNAASLAEYVKGVGGIVTGLSLLLALLYNPLFEASPMQGSLGKHFIGIFVTDTEGHRIGFWRALMRNLAKVTSSFILGIGYLMIAFTKQKQGLHDIIAGCLVLKHEHHQEG